MKPAGYFRIRRFRFTSHFIFLHNLERFKFVHSFLNEEQIRAHFLFVDDHALPTNHHHRNFAHRIRSSHFRAFQINRHNILMQNENPEWKVKTKRRVLKYCSILSSRMDLDIFHSMQSLPSCTFHLFHLL